MTNRLLIVAMLAGVVFAAHEGLQIDSQRNASAAVLEERAAAPPAFEFINPRIADRGEVVRLPGATDQPRSGAKIIVDITRGGDPAEVNAAIEKITRYVNIYAGAGREAADAAITVVLHGDATLCALHNDAYAAQFGTDGNPNIPIFQELAAAGVEFRVCGQSLAGKGYDARGVCDEVEVAVSALTVLVNHQADGYAYIPMLK